MKIIATVYIGKVVRNIEKIRSVSAKKYVAFMIAIAFSVVYAQAQAPTQKTIKKHAIKQEKNKRQVHKPSIARKAKGTKATLRRLATQMANRAHALKNVLWGAGSFGEHYLRRFGLAFTALGAMAVRKEINKRNARLRGQEEQEHREIEPANIDEQLQVAVREGNIDQARKLLKNGARAGFYISDSGDNKANCALGIAARKGDIAMVSLLLNYLPLISTDQAAHLCAIKNTLYSVAEIKKSNDNYIAIITLLIDHLNKHDITLQSEYIGESAIGSGDCAIIRVLIEAERNSEGKFVFFGAGNMRDLLRLIDQHNRVDLLRMLFDVGINLTKSEKEGLIINVMGHSEQIVQEVLMRSSIDEIPFDFILTTARLHDYKDITRQLLRMCITSLEENNQFQHGKNDEQKEQRAEIAARAQQARDHIQRIRERFRDFVSDNNIKEVTVWLDIMNMDDEHSSVSLDDRIWSWQVGLEDAASAGLPGMVALLLTHTPKILQEDAHQVTYNKIIQNTLRAAQRSTYNVIVESLLNNLASSSSTIPVILDIAIHYRDFDTITSLLRKGYSRQELDTVFNRTTVPQLLNILIQNDRADLLQNMFASEINFSLLDIQGAIDFAARSERNEVLKILLTRTQVSYRDIVSDELWYRVVRSPDDELLQMLVDKRKEANADDDYLRGALCNAVERDNPQRLRWLFEQGATTINHDEMRRIDPRTNIGQLLMTKAIEKKSLDSMKVLFERCPYADLVNRNTWSAVAISGNIEMLTLLLNERKKHREIEQNEGAFEDIQDLDSPLRLAVDDEWTDAVSLLICHGANCRIKYNDGSGTLLDKALQNRSVEMAKVLVDAGASMCHVSPGKPSPLDNLGSTEPEKRLVGLLVEKRQLIGLQDRKAFEVAARLELDEVVEQFAVEDVSHDFDDDGYSPIKKASESICRVFMSMKKCLKEFRICELSADIFRQQYGMPYETGELVIEYATPYTNPVRIVFEKEVARRAQQRRLEHQSRQIQSKAEITPLGQFLPGNNTDNKKDKQHE